MISDNISMKQLRTHDLWTEVLKAQEQQSSLVFDRDTVARLADFTRKLRAYARKNNLLGHCVVQAVAGTVSQEHNRPFTNSTCIFIVLQETGYYIAINRLRVRLSANGDDGQLIVKATLPPHINEKPCMGWMRFSPFRYEGIPYTFNSQGVMSIDW